MRASTRWGMVALAFGLIAVFAVAARLVPDPSGFGTHRQLGLPECPFSRVTGKRCPSCGMTTAFAWFVRGRILSSVRANAAGTLLAGNCLILIPWLIVGAALGKTPGCRSLERPLFGLAALTVTSSLICWTVQLFRDT